MTRDDDEFNINASLTDPEIEWLRTNKDRAESLRLETQELDGKVVLKADSGIHWNQVSDELYASVDSGAAIALGRLALRLMPKTDELAYQRAELHLEIGIDCLGAGQVEEAQLEFGQVLELLAQVEASGMHLVYFGDDLVESFDFCNLRVHAFSWRGQTHSSQGQPELALKDYEKALENEATLDRDELTLDDIYALTHARRGHAQFFMDQFDQARESYEVALDLYEAFELRNAIAPVEARIEAVFMLGRTLLELGRHHEAGSTLESALELYKHSEAIDSVLEADLLQLWGTFLSQVRDDHTMALQAYESASRIFSLSCSADGRRSDHGHVKALTCSGLELIELGRYQEARARCDRAFDLLASSPYLIEQPDYNLDCVCAWLIVRVGTAQKSQGTFEGLLDACNRALFLYKKHPDEAFGIAECHLISALAQIHLRNNRAAQAAFDLGLAHLRLDKEHHLEYWWDLINEGSDSLDVELLLLLSNMTIEVRDSLFEVMSAESIEAFLRIHSTLLEACMEQSREDLIPEVLTRMNGGNFFSMVFAGAEAAMDGRADAEIQRYLELEKQIRLLRLEYEALMFGASHSSESIGLEHPLPAVFLREMTKGSQADRVRQLRSQLRPLVKEFRLVHSILDSRYHFRIAKLHESIEGRALIEKLADSDVLVLLYSLFDSEPEESYALLLANGEVRRSPIRMDGLNNLVGKMRRFSDQKSAHRTQRRDISCTEDQSHIERGALVTVDEIDTEMREKFWRVLEPHLRGFGSVYILSHGQLHLLPYELGRVDTSRQVMLFPGIGVYWLRMHERVLVGAAKNPLKGRIDARGYSPERNPIPMVDAEIDALTKVWSTTEVEAPVMCLHLAAHGQHDVHTGLDVSSLVLGPRIKDRITFFEVLNDVRQPAVVFLSACVVARTSDSTLGDPLGLPAAFIARGAELVIGSTVPVSDFVAPILAILFYQSWRADPDSGPQQALLNAKSRMRSGDWSPDTENLIRDCYSKAIARFITGLNPVLRRAKLLHLLDDWFEHDAGSKSLAALARLHDEPDSFAQAVVDKLIKDRHRLRLDEFLPFVIAIGEWSPSPPAN